jgi:hypothetical protein
MPAQGLGRRLTPGAPLMDRPYLQDPLPADKIQPILDWHGRIVSEASRDTMWIIVDGAILGAEGLKHLQAIYGDPVRAFDNSALADYEELGPLLWPLSRAIEKDSIEALRTTLSGKPGLSFIRTGNSLALLTHTLAWLTGVVTEDGLPLYLRIGDTRVLPSVFHHLTPEQHAAVQGAVKEWAWFDRASKACIVRSDGGSAPSVPEEACRIDDAQYAALLEDAGVDLLHAELRRALPESLAPHTCVELHSWLEKDVKRAEALGLVRLSDQVVFSTLSLNLPDGFEALGELEPTWLDMRSGTPSLGKRIERWSDREWGAIENFRRDTAERLARERFASALKKLD